MTLPAEGADAPLMVCVAPNGARRTKADHPALPITPEELAETAARCAEAGAQAIHLHVRDAEGRHSLEPDRYRAALEAIEARVPTMLVQVTSEAAGVYDRPQQQAAILALRPRAVSIALRELAPEGGEDEAQRFYARLAELGAAVQHILYSPDEALRLRRLVDRGVVPTARPAVLFVLGRYAAGQVSDPADLIGFHQAWEDAGPWSVCAFGRTEPRCLAASIGLGGHVRVGFENNLLDADGGPAPDNPHNVANAVALARHAGRRMATREEAQVALGWPRDPI